MDSRAEQQQYNPYRVFPRAEWAKLRHDMPMTLAANDAPHHLHGGLKGWDKVVCIAETAETPESAD